MAQNRVTSNIIFTNVKSTFCIRYYLAAKINFTGKSILAVPDPSKWHVMLTIIGHMYILYGPGDMEHLMFQDVTAKYSIYDKVPSLLMSFFVRIKGCVNFHEMTPIHKKRVFARC